MPSTCKGARLKPPTASEVNQHFHIILIQTSDLLQLTTAMSMGEGESFGRDTCGDHGMQTVPPRLTADAKFPGQHGTGLPPSPSRENPGQVRDIRRDPARTRLKAEP